MLESDRKSLRHKLEIRLEGLKAVRQPYEDEARQIASLAQPARSRFLTTQRDKPGIRRVRNQKLLDSHGIEAFRTLTNGMTSGLSSPSRPWFTLKLGGNPDLGEGEGVRDWLSEVEREMYRFMARTNFYAAMKSGYAELGLFGTEACVMVEHPEVGAVCHSLTFGEYWIALGSDLRPDTLYRRCPMTVRQAVQQFGSRVSNTVKQAYDRSDYQSPVDVLHAIEPNTDYKPGVIGSKRWRSVYWDVNAPAGETLQEGGYSSQPFWAPRWDAPSSGDTYGVSPGMEALPALRELQVQCKRRNSAIDHLVDPEKVVPAGLRLTGEPGRTVSGNGITKDMVVVPYQMPYQAVAALGDEILKCRQQIDALSYADLFNAITNMQGIQPRNMEEIASRNEEKLTQLGPVIERVSTEKLQVAIDRVYDIMARGGLLPEVPEALSEAEIEVEFVSTLQQLQRMVGLGQIERGAAFAGNTAGVAPSILDNFDFDEMAREYADRAGMPAKILRSATEVEKLRAAREQQEQQAKMAEMAGPMREGVEAAKLLSETQIGGAPALDRMMGL